MVTEIFKSQKIQSVVQIKLEAHKVTNSITNSFESKSLFFSLSNTGLNSEFTFPSTTPTVVRLTHIVLQILFYTSIAVHEHT